MLMESARPYLKLIKKVGQNLCLFFVLMKECYVLVDFHIFMFDHTTNAYCGSLKTFLSPLSNNVF
jgi:hypothetical protein